jgi:hypothetical protein
LQTQTHMNDTKNFNEGTRFQIEPPGFDASEFSSFHTTRAYFMLKFLLLVFRFNLFAHVCAKSKLGKKCNFLKIRKNEKLHNCSPKYNVEKETCRM